ncbi:hypothetical protein C8Q80DRAFT_709088 [Daedaleopsis nitida]|nr:hypothetical protein C8Q80DRAFT_709088 [Daedaleopsis nitida]
MTARATDGWVAHSPTSSPSTNACACATPTIQRTRRELESAHAASGAGDPRPLRPRLRVRVSGKHPLAGSQLAWQRTRELTLRPNGQWPTNRASASASVSHPRTTHQPCPPAHSLRSPGLSALSTEKGNAAVAPSSHGWRPCITDSLQPLDLPWRVWSSGTPTTPAVRRAPLGESSRLAIALGHLDRLAAGSLGPSSIRPGSLRTSTVTQRTKTIHSQEHPPSAHYNDNAPARPEASQSARTQCANQAELTSTSAITSTSATATARRPTPPSGPSNHPCA